MSLSRKLLLAGTPVVVLVGVVALAMQPAHADGPIERVLNGTFDSVKAPWWSSANTPSAVADGKLCATVPGGTVNVWDSMIGQDDIPLESGQAYTLQFTASATQDVTIRAVVQLSAAPHTTVMNKAAALTSAPKTFTFTATSPVTDPHGQVSFQMGATGGPYTLCLDDISLAGGVVPPGGIRDFGSPVRVNQHGYRTDGPKRATIVDPSAQPQDWQLKDAAGAVVATGKTTVYGDDAMSGDRVHLADFTGYKTRGSAYTLTVGGAVSLQFAIGRDVYDSLRSDSLEFFYLMRSGIPIEARYAGDAYARPAGHVGVAPNTGDVAVPCLPGTCGYSLDVRGGWYDAGDQGKYVVNGALAEWQLVDLYERAAEEHDRAALAGDLSRIPDASPRIPAVLVESRWEMEFLLRMQVPAGQPLAGMAHHKIHDVAWTPLPTQPQNDPQPRYLYPPSTAATLNLAAAGAQCARVWERYDPPFARRCLAAAQSAWNAARQHPDVYAPAGGVGGGAYADTDVTDEFSWAASELYATTHDRRYLPSITTGLTAAGFSWQSTGGLADLVIVRNPQRFPREVYQAARRRVLSVADAYVRDEYAQGYANPFLPGDGKYTWGSNSSTTNNAMIIATAYDLTRDARYRTAALESMDYVLGRNAVNQSYITGYGERASQNQHTRIWSHELDPSLPNPPPGSFAGGPNSFLQDPVAQRNLPGCAPAKCYLDEINSYSTNEVAVNWASSLAWMAAFAAQD